MHNELITKRLEMYNDLLLKRDIGRVGAGLYFGKMGLAIYAFHEADKRRNDDMLKLAERLVTSIYSSPPSSDISLERGMLGVALGLKYLLKKGFVEGDANDVLKELDDKLYKSLYFDYIAIAKQRSIDDYLIILQVSLYFAERLEDEKLNKQERLLFERILIKVINEIDDSMRQVKLSHPNMFYVNHYLPFLYFSLIAKMYSLKIYRYKLDMVCKKWTETILTLYPQRGFGKLMIVTILDKVALSYKDERWIAHLNTLRKGININEIVNNEFGNKNILLHGGLSGFHSFCKVNSMLTNEEECNLIDRIVRSDLWDSIKLEQSDEAYVGLYSGVYGALLASQGIYIDKILS